MQTAPAAACQKHIPPLKDPVFVADLHLSEDHPRTTAVFLKFLKEQASEHGALVILGDLFEFWAGDDQLPQYRPVIEALRAYTKSGRTLYVMHGNRDFLLGEEFAAATGAILINDPCQVRCGLDNLLLAHGDIWCTLDTEYQQMRQTVRDPELQLQVLGEKLEDRLELAQSLRNQSRMDTADKDLEKMDVVVREVARSARTCGSSIVVHGHTHRPNHHVHVNEDFRFDRWVLPDWDFDNGNNRGGYLTYHGGYLHFVKLDGHVD